MHSVTTAKGESIFMCRMAGSQDCSVEDQPQSTVNIATICKGDGEHLGRYLRRLVTSLLEHSSHLVIRLVLLTDPQSRPWVEKVVEATWHTWSEALERANNTYTLALQPEYVG